jgi:hypothetical protein
LNDQETSFQSIPVGKQVSGGLNSHLSQFGITARDSRLALRVDGDAGKTKLAAYFEGDFFGTGPTSNLNLTNSYNYRIRQAWGRAKFANGWTITGGQMWHLITLNRKGVDADNANLWIPNIIEASYSVGYDWGRFGEIRIGKQLNDKVAAAISFANTSYLNQTNNLTAGVSGLAAPGTGNNANSLVNACSSTINTTATAVTTTCTVTPTYSTNLAPDMAAKIAFDDPRFGHYEVKGLARIFRNRVQPTATTGGHNNEAVGYGVGAGAVIPIKPKKVDFIAQGLWGKGISRYQASGQFDFVTQLPFSVTVAGVPTTFEANRNMKPIEAFSGLVGIETHPKPKMELDFIVGDEYYKKTLYTGVSATGATAVNGYGAPGLVNTGCYYENLAQYTGSGITGAATATALPACSANNRNLIGAQVIFYYDLYKGPMGTLRYGVSYEYLERATWGGVVATPAGLTTGSPKGINNIAFTTMRYIFP